MRNKILIFLSLPRYRKIILMAFIIVCLTFRHQVFASGFHFGIIDAIEDKIDELREKLENPGGPGEPTIEFTYVPPYGSFENLKGRVRHVKPGDYKIAVYILSKYVSGWWTKPYRELPLTSIHDDGTWICDITTDGIDQSATKIAAFLVRNGYDLPLMSGGQTLPSELYQDSVASIEVERILRTIAFSGYNWKVDSCREEDIWVDGDDQLHMKLTMDGKCFSTEVFTEASLGYGKYIFYLASRVDQLDKNIVVGFFTWDDTAPEYNYREIDIEFSKWGQTIGDNAQYVVQPFTNAGNMKRFNMELNGDYSTHIFNWSTDSIFFQSLHGHYSSPPADSYIIESWTYTGSDIPPAGKQNVIITLWLMNDNGPCDSEDVEIVIKKFEFVPSDEVEPY